MKSIGGSTATTMTPRPVAATTLRVLLAEPDRQRREVYREAFHAFGCDVIEAADGRETLVEALVRKPSLIVMQTWLPFVNGPALCEILRRDATTSAVPILAIVDGDSSIDADRMRRAGADATIAAPAKSDVLLAELVRLTSTPRNNHDVDHAALLASVSDTRKRQAVSRLHPRFTTTTPPAVPPT